MVKAPFSVEVCELTPVRFDKWQYGKMAVLMKNLPLYNINIEIYCLLFPAWASDFKAKAGSSAFSLFPSADSAEINKKTNLHAGNLKSAAHSVYTI